MFQFAEILQYWNISYVPSQAELQFVEIAILLLLIPEISTSICSVGQKKVTKPMGTISLH